ncbi:MAG: helix-turn-helix domain-containing protein [Clostridiales bacterium]|nr:helix-turn-helix domain-containing protein [Clostridiales bacterium]
MDANETGRFIAELRKQKGYTQKELAEKLMVTDKAISRWETGRGLPDTSLLKPLGDILDVSVSELLAGKRLDVAETKEETDKIILESLNYSKRMLASTLNAILFLIGILFILSPLFLASQNYAWIFGVAIVVIALFCIYIRKRKGLMKVTNKTYYLAAVVLQCVALILEALPIGVVMVFATSPTERATKTYSYFSLLPLGYANVTPMLTGILTVVIIMLGVITLFKFEKTSNFRRKAFICSIIALIFSIIPLLQYGTAGMTTASYTVSGALALSICLQAVANRQDPVNHFR